MGFLNTIKKAFAYDIDDVITSKGGCTSPACNKYLWKKIQARQALLYYKKVSPLFTSVRFICDAFSSLDIVLKDKETGEMIRDHELLTLLNSPNADLTGTEFLDQSCSYYVLTGNNYWVATGSVDSNPLEVFVKAPQSVMIKTSPEDNLASLYEIQQGSSKFSFRRDADKSGKFRFYNRDRTQELWQIRKFNPDYPVGDPYGMSDLNPIYYELEQFESSNVHNLSMLKRGARLSGILMSEGAISNEQFAALREQFSENNLGESNVGSVFFAEGNKFDYKPLDMTNKDMDFATLKKEIKNQIYVNLKMPLPLVSPDHMTMDNFGQARLFLYENVVLPLADTMLHELGNFLLPRYKDGDKYELTYDKNSISALESKMIEDIERKQRSGVFADNEIRKLYGEDEYDNGDLIYKPSAMVEVGSTSKTAASKEMFIEELKHQGMSEENIKTYVKKYYGHDN